MTDEELNIEIDTLFDKELYHIESRFKGKLNRRKILKWLSNFKGDDKLFAIELLLEMVFVSDDDLYEECDKLLNKLVSKIGEDDHIFLIPVAKYGKSASLISYYLSNSPVFKSLLAKRKVTFVPRLRVLRDIIFTENSTLVYFDDFIGTGGSLRKTIANVRLNTNSSRKNIKSKYVVCLYYMQSAFKSITELNRNFEFIGNVHLKKFDSEPLNYPSVAQKEKCKAIFHNYADVNKLFDDNGTLHNLGYKNSQANIAFHYKPPNNSLPVIWSHKGNWFPLLPRDPTIIIRENKKFKEETAYAAALMVLEADKNIAFDAKTSKVLVVVYSIIRLIKNGTSMYTIQTLLSISSDDMNKHLNIAVNMKLLDEKMKLTELGHASVNKLVTYINDYKSKKTIILKTNNSPYIPEKIS